METNVCWLESRYWFLPGKCSKLQLNIEISQNEKKRKQYELQLLPPQMRSFGQRVDYFEIVSSSTFTMEIKLDCIIHPHIVLFKLGKCVEIMRLILNAYVVRMQHMLHRFIYPYVYVTYLLTTHTKTSFPRNFPSTASVQKYAHSIVGSRKFPAAAGWFERLWVALMNG